MPARVLAGSEPGIDGVVVCQKVHRQRHMPAGERHDKGDGCHASGRHGGAAVPPGICDARHKECRCRLTRPAVRLDTTAYRTSTRWPRAGARLAGAAAPDRHNAQHSAITCIVRYWGTNGLPPAPVADLSQNARAVPVRSLCNAVTEVRPRFRILMTSTIWLD